jgi:hypothetical protein
MARDKNLGDLDEALEFVERWDAGINLNEGPRGWFSNHWVIYEETVKQKWHTKR